MTVRGKIFPELWVDCFNCRTAKACGESKYPAAARSARQMGWRRMRIGTMHNKERAWLCPLCVPHIGIR